MKDKSAAIHSRILNIEAVSSPIDESGNTSGVWARPEEMEDEVVRVDGPLVGVLSFPGNPGHVNVFMRTMEGDVLYIDPQSTKASRVTKNRIVFKDLDSSAVFIGLCGPDIRFVEDAVRRMRGAGGAASGGGGGGGSSSSSVQQ